jgi:GTP-binding protein YchF
VTFACVILKTGTSFVKAGIIGPRSAGKSTVFHALTGLSPLQSQPSKNRARPGQIRVPDARLEFLERVCESKKQVPVELTVLDFAPSQKEAKPGAVLDGTLIPLMRELDSILIVIASPAIGGTDLLPTLQSIEEELVFADFEQAERRLERIKKEKAPDEVERAALQRVMGCLEQGTPLRTLDLSAQEAKVLSHFCFLSQKPALVVINCPAEEAAHQASRDQAEAIQARCLQLFPMAAAFEAELWELEEKERDELLNEAGLTASAADRLTAALFRRLGLMTFYTAGEPEAHAWSLPAGSSALDAAAKIHSDIARGFIRAEVISFADFEQFGSEAKVKAAGRLRLEGKDYVMQDGDVIHIRFKV